MASLRNCGIGFDITSCVRTFIWLICFSRMQVLVSQESCSSSHRTSPERVYVIDGDNSSFSCISSNNPNMLRISVTGGPSIEYEDFPGYSRNILDNGNFTVFFMKTFTLQNQSTIRCCWTGVNNCCTTSLTTVLVPGRPSPVAVNSVSITPSVSSMRVTWDVPWSFPVYPITSYSIEVIDVSTQTVTATETVNTNEALISNLSAVTHYMLRISSQSRSGTAEHTTVDISTLPLGQIFSAPSSSFIVLPHNPSPLKWTYSLRSEVTTPPYFVVDGTTYSLLELGMLSEVISVSSNQVETEVNVTLGASWNNTIWQWRLEQYDSQLSSTVQIIVADLPLPPPIPTGVNLTASSMGLILRPPFSHTRLTGYTVQYRMKNSASGEPLRSRFVRPLFGLESEPVKVTLDELQLGGVYTILVFAGNEVGNSSSTEVDLSLGPSQEGICLMDRDPIWRFEWEFTFSGEVDKQACISTSIDSGLATRECVDGVWGPPVVDECKTPSLSPLLNSISAVSLSSCYTGIVVETCLVQVARIIEEISSVVSASDLLFPVDLGVIASALHNTTRLQEYVVTEGFNVVLPLQDDNTVTQYALIFGSMFDISRSNGWTLLQMDNRSLAADEVLYSFIKTVTVLANISQNDQTNPLFTDSNFVSTFGTSTSVDVEIPTDSCFSGLSYVVNNFAGFLPSVWPDGVTAADVDSVLVVVDSTCPGTSNTAEQTKVTFKYDEPPYRPLCAVWQFEVSSGSVSGRGEWSTEGVETISDKWSNEVTCYSSQSLPITVLTNYRGPDFTADALSVAFYTGTTLAALLFVFSIVPLAAFIHHERKTDKRVILSVSQLNYAAVNIVTLVILAAGVETGRNNDTSSTFVPAGCKVVAALLHYLYLCTLLWLFIISLVLLCMYVEIGRAIVKRWWPAVIVAYATPVPVIVISAPIAHQFYGSELGCWLSFQNGTVFGFVAPAALTVIAVVVSFTIGCVFICKYKSDDDAQDQDVELIAQRKQLIWTTIMFFLVHFPLLCLVWIFGFLYLGTGIEVYAIVYAVLIVGQSTMYVLFQILKVNQIRRFWLETVYRRLKEQLRVERQPTPPTSIANPMRTGRYIADGRLGIDVSMTESTDFSPFSGTDTSTYKTDTTFIYNW